MERFVDEQHQSEGNRTKLKPDKKISADSIQSPYDSDIDSRCLLCESATAMKKPNLHVFSPVLLMPVGTSIPPKEIIVPFQKRKFAVTPSNTTGRGIVS